MKRESGSSGSSGSSDDSDPSYVPRRRGRPSGLPAWNRGRALDPSHRAALSAKAKERHAADPSLRWAVAEKLKGRDPWNKKKQKKRENGGTDSSEGSSDDDNSGTSDNSDNNSDDNSDDDQDSVFSAETREKMRLAALARGRKSRETRLRMAAKAKGRKLPLESRRKLSRAKKGESLSPEHRAAIAAAARKRHAADRVLRAVQEAYAGLSPAPKVGGESNSDSESSSSSKRSPLAIAAAAKPSPSPSSSSASSSSSSSNPSVAVGGVLSNYMAGLRELRALQAELAPWTDAFREAHQGRKPGLADVHASGVPWIVAKYRQYVLLRERVLTDTQALRPRLEDAKKGFADSGFFGSGGGGSGGDGSSSSSLTLTRSPTRMSSAAQSSTSRSRRHTA